MQIDSSIPEVARRQIEHIAEVCERIKPLVVIHCITYNHEAFLKDALEGFLMQKTDFPFVAVVHDDASTDGTAAVLREYAERYPDIILPIFEEENQYSKRNKSIRRIMNSAKLATGAKYVAMCEGDDYWTYEHKLQKQVDFLESHPDYSMCYHNVVIHREKKDSEDELYFRENIDKKETFQSFIHVPTASMLFKLRVLDSPYFRLCIESTMQMNGDNLIVLSCGAYGRIKYIDDIMGVYRILPTGWSMTKGVDINVRLYTIKYIREYEKIFGRLYQSLIKEYYARKSREGIESIRHGKILDGVRIFYLCFQYAPVVTIRSYWYGLLKRLKSY